MLPISNTPVVPSGFEVRYVQPSSSDKVKAFLLNLFSLGVWSKWQNHQLEKALKANTFYINKAEEAIRKGATHRVSMKTFEGLLKEGKDDAALFIAGQMAFEDFQKGAIVNYQKSNESPSTKSPIALGEPLLPHERACTRSCLVSEIFEKVVEQLSKMNVAPDDNAAKAKFEKYAQAIKEYQRVYFKICEISPTYHGFGFHNLNYCETLKMLFNVALYQHDREKLRIWRKLNVNLDTVGYLRQDMNTWNTTHYNDFKYLVEEGGQSRKSNIKSAIRDYNDTDLRWLMEERGVQPEEIQEVLLQEFALKNSKYQGENVVANLYWPDTKPYAYKLYLSKNYPNHFPPIEKAQGA